MGWLKKVHECSRPNAWNHGVGSRWQCRKCLRIWEVKSKQTQGLFLTTVWRVVQDDS